MDKPERLRVLNTLAERISNGNTADALSFHGDAFDLPSYSNRSISP